MLNYKGGKRVMQGLEADEIDVGWLGGIQKSAVLASEIVNLASGLDRPLDISPNAPLITDIGSDYALTGYLLLMAPAGLPEAAREAISEAVVN